MPLLVSRLDRASLTPTASANTRRRRGVGALRAVAALLVVVGCGAPAPVRIGEGPRTFTPADYEDVYDAWTRTEEDFAWGRMRDVLRVTATFESWEFRWAYVVRYAEDHSILPEARDEMLRATLDDSRQFHRFFVTLAGDQFRESNIAGRQSAWRILLMTPDGRQAEPLDIERVRRPTAAQQVYFPSATRYRQAFRLVFAAQGDDGADLIGPDAEFVKLRFTGARGRVDLRWDVAR